MTVNTNNGYHPSPEPEPQSATGRFSGHVVTGPDGKPWGALAFKVGSSEYRIAMPEDMLSRFAEDAPRTINELRDLVRQHRLAAAGLALPVLPPFDPPRS